MRIRIQNTDFCTEPVKISLAVEFFVGRGAVRHVEGRRDAGDPHVLFGNVEAQLLPEYFNVSRLRMTGL
jgi:hypothetical protein